MRRRTLWIGLAALVLLPFAMRALGLSTNTASQIVCLAIAALGLNLLVGFTGLTSFGHSAWYGIGAYAAAIAQKHWFPGQIALPLLLSAVFVAGLSCAAGMLILRRRGVYFALLTLAFVALTYAIAFRWTEVTGGEDGLGGLSRGGFAAVPMKDGGVYYAFVALVALGVLYALLRVTRSPFGHVLVAIRENQQRATFQGYDVDRYRLAAFVLSAVVTGLGGALQGFLNYFVSAESVSVPFSGELLAMVVIGGMHTILGPALGVLFYVLFRELFSMWTQNWLLWFGLVFVGFVLFSPEGLMGVWARIRRRLRPPPEESAAMNRRAGAVDRPLPAFLYAAAVSRTVLDIESVSKRFGGIRAVEKASLTVRSGEVHALIGPNGAGKTTLFNVASGMFPLDGGTVSLDGRSIAGLPPHRVCGAGVARSFQITNLFRRLTLYENLRLSVQARHAARFNAWRDVDDYAEIHAETAELVAFLGLEGIEEIHSGDLSYGGQRLVDLGIALGSGPRALLLDEPLAGLAAAERELVCALVKSVAEGIPVLIVEHDVDRVLGLSHAVTVMNEGAVLMSGTPEEVRNDRRVQEVYTGSGTPPKAQGGLGRAAGESGAQAPLLRFEGVNSFYGKSHILNDATLDVREGEIVALVGRNGAGKSTLLKTLVGLLPPASGTIEYEGRDIAGMPAPDIARAGIGYVPQGRGLFAGMTAAENLALGRLARATDGSHGIVWNEATIFEHFPRLEQRMRVAADYLSGGEQQMAAVARALSGNVKLLLLDEPFEGLAPAVVRDLFEVFDRLRGRCSMVIVEHNLDLVLALADRVFALERGAVFHQGPAAPLLEDLDYRKKILWL